MAATRTSKPARGGLERFGSRRNGVAGATALAIALGVASVATALAASPEDPVKRGEYLARAGDCVSCHTAGSGLDGAVGGAAAEGVAFAGGLAISTPFGVIVSPNITPDDETGIGTWTAEDFWRSMHFGVGKRGEPLYPVMPYDFFTKVAREDSDAIFAYLKSLKPVRNAVEVNQLHWPYDMRFAAMSVWQALWFAPSVFEPNPSTSEAWNRGAYLVEALGHCGACHKPRNFMGAVTPSKDFTGATVDQWFAPNITTNSRLGIGGYTVDQLTQFFKDGVTPPAVEQPGDGASGGRTTKPLQTTVGPMAAVWRNSLQYLTETDAKAMATYLKSLPPAGALGSGFAIEGVCRRREAIRRELRALSRLGWRGPARPRAAACRQSHGDCAQPQQPHFDRARRTGAPACLDGDAEFQGDGHGRRDRRHGDLCARRLGQRRLAREPRGGRDCPQGRRGQVAPAAVQSGGLAPFQRPRAFAVTRTTVSSQPRPILDRLARFADLMETDADEPAWRSDARS